MKGLRCLAVFSVVIALFAFAPAAVAQVAPPPLPDLTPVTLDPATTGFLVLDMTSVICPPRPACTASVPSVGHLLAKARAAGVFVGYSTTGTGDILPELSPRSSDPVVVSRADKFFNTDLAGW